MPRIISLQILSKSMIPLLCILLLSGSTCSTVTLPPPSCPTSFITPLPLQIAAQSNTTSVDLSLSPAYINKRIRAVIQTPETDQQGKETTQGADVKSVALSQKLVNGQPLHLIEARVEPWIRRQSDHAHATLNNTYKILLKVNAYIVNSNTVSDSTRRKQFLCGSSPQCSTDEGILLGFELYEIDNVSQGTVVATGNGACGTVNHIDKSILEAIWGVNGGLTKAMPIPFPTASIAKMMESITGSPARVTGISLGTDQALKVGMLLNTGTPLPFDSSTGFKSDEDWNLEIRGNLIRSAVEATVQAGAVANNPPASVNNIEITFLGQPDNTIDVAAHATIPVCDNSGVLVRAHVRFDVCTDRNNRPILQQCQKDQANLTGDFLNEVCVGVDHLFRGWGGPTTAYINNLPCGTDVTSISLMFPISPEDSFYATGLDISNNVFSIVGRSTVMDAAANAAGHGRNVKPHPCAYNFNYQFP